MRKECPNCGRMFETITHTLGQGLVTLESGVLECGRCKAGCYTFSAQNVPGYEHKSCRSPCCKCGLNGEMVVREKWNTKLEGESP
jgi:hypothetical protein